MKSLSRRRLRPISLVALIFVCSVGTRAVEAGPAYMFLVVDPATTAGGGVASSGGFDVTSNRSGAGTWHLYAVDDLADSYGIRSFFVKLNGDITSINNRSPVAQYYGDPMALATEPANVGFDLIRGTEPCLAASQNPYSNTQIGGMGISAGNFQQTGPGQYSPGATSGQWGTYADPFTSGSLGDTGRTRNALFLAEGTYTGAAPTVDVTTSLADGGSGINYWTDPGLTRSETAPLLSSSNPFACPDCVNNHDPFLVSTSPKPPTPPPTPSAPPLTTPAPPATSPPPTPPVAANEPQKPPAAANDPPPDPLVPVVPPLWLDPSEPDGNYNSWGLVSTGVPIMTIDHDGLIYFNYMPTGSAVTMMPYNLSIKQHGGLLAAMTTGLTGLAASDISLNPGWNDLASASFLTFASFNSLASEQRLVSASLESAAAAPEPAALALVGLALVGFGGLVARRRS